jgi:glutathione S-transferase
VASSRRAINAAEVTAVLKLWGRTNSINVHKALWCLDELGLEYERIDAGMAFGVVDTPEYRALNPNGRIPTLQDGDLTLWESNVIVRYLAARYGAGTLWPDDLAARAIADQWMDWQQTTIHAPIAFVFWGQIRGRKENQDAAKVAEASAAMVEMWSMLDRHLASRDFVAGDTLTMGDIAVGVAMWRWWNLDVEHPDLPSLYAWHERVQARPGYERWVMLPLE